MNGARPNLTQIDDILRRRLGRPALGARNETMSDFAKEPLQRGRIADRARRDHRDEARTTRIRLAQEAMVQADDAMLTRLREAEGQGFDGETLAQAKDRLSDDLEDPLDEHRNSRGREGWKDVGHAIPNVLVSWAREDPYSAGHWMLYAGIAGVVLLIAWAVLG